ncbi:hypothetical protein BGW39_007240 [Mortierella sp. 14UC]|nr:hypothetical protein BGW39_007240 [Mortierella sp. 14UC]
MTVHSLDERRFSHLPTIDPNNAQPAKTVDKLRAFLTVLKLKPQVADEPQHNQHLSRKAKRSTFAFHASTSHLPSHPAMNRLHKDNIFANHSQGNLATKQLTHRRTLPTKKSASPITETTTSSSSSSTNTTTTTISTKASSMSSNELNNTPETGALELLSVSTSTQAMPSVDCDLRTVRLRRLDEAKPLVYTAPMAKATLQAKDNDLFPLLDNILEFLDSEREVMLILGDAGAGKSTFNRHLETHLWTDYSKGGPIPLFINLPAIEQPEQDMVTKQLQMYNFEDEQIQEMKENRQFILICDGYDESPQTVNLHTANRLNQQGGWHAKMIISCRTQYLGPAYQERFAPEATHQYQTSRLDLFQEAVIVPFSEEQVEDYVTRYTAVEPRPWNTAHYMQALTSIPNLLDLVKNPFLLMMALEVLPVVTNPQKDLSRVRISRIQLYDHFVDQWLGLNLRRLQNCILTKDDRESLKRLVEVGFTSLGIGYATRLALAMYDKQEGRAVVPYVFFNDKASWKAEFFGLEPGVRLLRESSPLVRSGILYRFIHRSMLEYFFSRAIFGPSNFGDISPAMSPTSPSANMLKSDSPLFTRSLLSEPTVIQFLCDRVSQSCTFEQQLLAVIEQSKRDASVATAAANAITILVRAGTRFNRADLKGIRIPGADVSHGQFDSAQLQGADLTDVNFARSWLRQADFSKAKMDGARFGELPDLKETAEIHACAYSPNGKLLAVGLKSGDIDVYDASSWIKLWSMRGHKKVVCGIAFSPDSQQLISGSGDHTLRLWDVTTGEMELVMEGHTGSVNAVAFLPYGEQAASASKDQTVRLWCLQTGESLFVLKGHTESITSVDHSPDGYHLISGSHDGTIHFWDRRTGAPRAVWESPFGGVECLAFSPDGRQVASGHRQDNVQLWDTTTGLPCTVLRGHNGAVTSVAFSASGRWIASASSDRTVRLWDASAGTLVSVLTSHNKGVFAVAFAPGEMQIASGGRDWRVRLWEVNTRGSNVEQQGHSDVVFSVGYTPDGRHIISGSSDGTIRQWDSITGGSGNVVVQSAEPFNAMAVSPDGIQIATGSFNSNIQLWNRQTGANEQTSHTHDRAVIDLTYSPCGRWIASSSKDRTVQLWDLQDAVEPDYDFVDDPQYCVYSVAFSPTGRQLATGNSNGIVRIFNLQSKEPLVSRRWGEEPVWVLAYSPNGRQLAIGTAGESIYVWDHYHPESTGQELDDHDSGVSCMAYSPCGQWIASGSLDETVRLWHQRRRPASDDEEVEEKTWSCVSIIRGFVDTILSISWNPLVPLEFVTGCEDRSVRVWRVTRNDTGGGGVTVGLVWGSNTGRLCASELKFGDALGIEDVYQQLLVQRGGAVGEAYKQRWIEA